MTETAGPSADVGPENNYRIQNCSGGCQTLIMHAKAPRHISPRTQALLISRHHCRSHSVVPKESRVGRIAGLLLDSA